MNLILAAKAHAILHGQHHVAADDVAAVAAPILRHRLILNFAAQSEGITVDDVIRRASLQRLAEEPGGVSERRGCEPSTSGLQARADGSDS